MLIVNGNIFFMLFQYYNLITWKPVPRWYLITGRIRQ